MAKGNVNYSEHSTADLREEISEQQSKLAKMKFNHLINPLDNHNVLKEMRKEIARMKTEISMRKKRGEL